MIPNSDRKAHKAGPAPSDEQKARSALSQAKNYLKNDRPADARESLRKVIKLAPDSELAKEAQELLAKIPGCD
jgi:Tfp pilus assembly protein PilF